MAYGKVNSAMQVDVVPSSGEVRYEPKVDYINSSASSLPDIPYVFSYGKSVVLNGEIHVLGGSGTSTAHYKYNGTAWESVSTLPYAFLNGCAIVHDGEIHILGSSFDDATSKNHYKFVESSSTWEIVSTLPYNFREGAAASYRGEIHLIGGSNGATRRNHYKWDGEQWINVGTLPYDIYQCGTALVFNGEINIIGGTGGQKTHGIYDGVSWQALENDLPVAMYNHDCCINEGKIHVLGGSGINTKHYVRDGEEWTTETDIPYTFLDGQAVSVAGKIYCLGTSYNSAQAVYVRVLAGKIEQLTFNVDEGCEVYSKESYTNSNNVVTARKPVTLVKDGKVCYTSVTDVGYFVAGQVVNGVEIESNGWYPAEKPVLIE